MELYLQETLRKTITFIPIQKFIKNFYLIYGLSKRKENLDEKCSWHKHAFLEKRLTHVEELSRYFLVEKPKEG